MIANKVSKAFAKQLANALIISKLNYNIEIWGNTSNPNKKKMDKILVEAAKTVLGKIKYGRTDNWILNEMKWLNTDKSYKNAVQNTVFKIIHNEDEHYFKHYIMNNRNVRTASQNKVGQIEPNIGHSQSIQKTFLFNNINIYNNLPKELMLIKHHHIFKKWLKRYNLNKKTKLKTQDDNNKVYIQQHIDYEMISRCQDDLNSYTINQNKREVPNCINFIHATL